MASPSVAGVAALLLDAVADYREQPALTRARLMASAIKPDAWLDAGGAFPADNSEGPGVLQAQYGLGKATARTSVLQRKGADGWENGAATSTLTAGSYGYQDIVVPEGASRLDLVLAWDEPPAATIGSTVLNDLDLWLDKDADCTAAACGEHASTSRRDNVEWIIVKNPAAGTYRARVVPQRVYTGAPRAGLAWTIIRDASTPSLRLAVEESRPIGPIDELRYRVVLSVSVDAYVAASVQVVLGSCRTKDGMCGRGVEMLPLKREDGVEYSPRFPASSAILVGEVGVGERQRVEFNVRLDAEDAVRLYFTASAWNADPAVASVELDADDDPETQPPSELPPPANDHFADAATLDGPRGQVDAEAVTATVEPGEPASQRSGITSVGSIWYRWTAPIRGATHFGTSAGADVAVFQGERIAALTRIGESPWNVSFFAEKGQTYHVRVSCLANTHNPCEPAQTLHWSQGPRPANDDFAAAVELPDAEGETAGDNRGATLEPGERFGNLVATVWYRWTAPEDGGWRFRTDQARVLVFTGDHVAALRLVSGGNSSFAPLRVQAGVEYRIAVAANESGRAFSLEWGKYERGANADDFANATDLEGTTSSERITVSTGYSVEPREPAQTGVTTRWWSWTAPSSGRFTWRLSDTQHTEIKVAVFTAADSADAEATPSLATLQFLASTGPRVTGTKFAFDAVGGQRYWISAGFHTGDDAAFRWNRSATLRWGETPANDSLAQAIALDGSSGTTTFASLFGTLEPGERDGILGASSLWWSFTPPKAGWYRFWLDETTSATLAVYRACGAGFDGLQLVARSHGDWQAPDADDATAVLFDAVAEQRYLIRVGQRGERDDSETTLNWDETNAPTWLRYAGRLRASALGLDAPETDATPALAFEDRGAVLYLAASQGVHIFTRDAASGTLAQARVANMEEPYGYGLLWDRGRGKLYMHVGCRGWRQLAPADDSRLALVDEGALEIVHHGDTLPCDVRHGAFLDSTGAFLYHGHPIGVEVYALGETGLTGVQSVAIEGLAHAVSNHAGTRVYATDGDSLQAFTRDENTGELTAAGEVELTVRAVAIAISDDDAYLVALARDGGTETYDLAVEGAVPRRLNNLNAFGNASWRDPDGECGFIAARRGAAAIDAFCRNSAFGAAIRVADESAKLAATDYVANWQADRFNNYIPEFKSQALATSPDGQHAYVYSEGDILIFERVGNQPPAQSEDATNASADRPWHGALATELLSP